MYTTGTLLTGVLFLGLTLEVKGHGRLWGPPARGTMWRFGDKYNTPHNYNDHQLFCGGFDHQVSQGYKCGLCGDPYDQDPRDHENQGKYATDIIVGNYIQGQNINVTVEITAYHKGWMEFSVCKTSPTAVLKEDCIPGPGGNMPLLELADDSGTKFEQTHGFSGRGNYTVNLKLPQHLTCSFCVLQWRYHAGNSYGVDKDGTGCVGCGYQEEFYGCANIAIAASTGSSDQPQDDESSQATTTQSTTSTTNSPTTTSTTTSPTTTTTTTNPTTTSTTETPTTTTTAGSASTCKAAGAYVGNAGMDTWCVQNCPGNCPSTHCSCSSDTATTSTTTTSTTTTSPSPSTPGCRATPVYANNPNMDPWCVTNCAAGFCPASHCTCT